MMMRLSTKSRYGTRMLLDLAALRGEGPVHLDDIARRQGISVKYLEQILIPLKKAGYVESMRGPKGGHYLARDPEEITVGEIVALLEGGPSLVECSEKPEACDRSSFCLTRRLWQEASQALYDKLASFTLADLLMREKVRPRKKGA
jgi:Rrf2 family transcriptional regulator, iron-sulfur cluster assembly transcription factor